MPVWFWKLAFMLRHVDGCSGTFVKVSFGGGGVVRYKDAPCPTCQAKDDGPMPLDEFRVLYDEYVYARDHKASHRFRHNHDARVPKKSREPVRMSRHRNVERSMFPCKASEYRFVGRPQMSEREHIAEELALAADLQADGLA